MRIDNSGARFARDSIMKVKICPNNAKPEAVALVPHIECKLRELGAEIADSPEDCDVLLTVGGDGTILKWSKTAARLDKPLLGINTGLLGFMATIEPDDLCLLSRLVSGEYHISKRTMMSVCLRNDMLTALNDVVLSKGLDNKLPEFSVRVKRSGIFCDVSQMRADGLIFSTPTGSTAYALSAGGPIIEPELSLVLFTPLCAHTLFSRPMIFSGEEDILITHTGGTVFVSADGDKSVGLSDGEELIIRKDERHLKLIDLSANSFYDAVQGKLMKPMK